ncbi:hypothetical protein [Candidatus Symbiobacter mobilis]|uniref:Uncharacterized protein n=1 Tax=Candidatus Symbiobacter mobilis CR TaxID=946483 RepID=U5N6R3_9BURK|nr:hypothetical protein [Candidatus Symbiobacter mobilis]AGX87072.1 hypothetical protein Cenrod_0971 [Candidatus Symbiobacter mobilis CR]
MRFLSPTLLCTFHQTLRIAACMVAWHVHAAPTSPLAPGDLLVELRPHAMAAGYVVSTESAGTLMEDGAVALRVRNGETATFERRTLHPASRVDAVQGGDRAPGVRSTLHWLPAGQKIVVQPRWPGGAQPATVEVEVRSDTLAAGTGVLPEPTQHSVQTTVTVPLHKWVAIALPQRSPAGSYSSEEAAQPIGLQLRVSQP